MKSRFICQKRMVFLGTAMVIAVVLLGERDCSAVTSVAVSPSTYTLRDRATSVIVQADTSDARGKLKFDVYMDLDGRGALDPEDPRFMSFEIADGQAPHLDNAAFWHDEDGHVNSSVRASLSANGAWWASGHFIVKVTDKGSSTETATFTVEQDSSLPYVISGEVQQAGYPAAGAVVMTEDVVIGQDISMALSEPDGTFEVRVQFPGWYRLYAVKPGSIAKFEEGSAQVIEVSGGPNALPAPLVVFPGDRTISGRVFALDTGEGFPGMVVFGEGEEFFSTAFTDDDGNYSLTAIDGEWEGIWVADEFMSRFGYIPPADESVTVSGSDVPDIDFPCQRATTLITGAVRDAETLQGLQGYWVLAVSLPDGRQLTTYSGQDGRYALGVTGGQWWIGVDNDRFLREGLATPPVQQVEAPPSGTLSGVDFLLEKSGTITGHIYEDDGVTPVPWVHLNAFEFGTWNFVAQAETVPDGSYTMWVPSGTYMVVTGDVEGWLYQFYLNAERWQDASPVVVTAPEETGGINFVLVREEGCHPCDTNCDMIIDDWELLHAIDCWARGETCCDGWPKNLDDYDWALLELVDLWAPGTEYDPDKLRYGDP